MALQRLTARAILTAPCLQGFVGAGRVVAYAHAMGTPTSPVPTSLEPASKRMPKRESRHERSTERLGDSQRRDWGLNANPNRLWANRSAA